MNQNTEIWEIEFGKQFPEHRFCCNGDCCLAKCDEKFAEEIKSFIRIELDRARQEGRDETIDYIRNHKHSEEAVKGLWYVSDDTFEAARQHKEG